MKHLIVVLTAFLPFSFTLSQSLSGKLTDNQGKPLPGGSVYVTELKQGTTSNTEGYYHLDLPPGSYTVHYQFLGYSPVTRTIHVGEGDTVCNISLAEQYYEIPAVRVSASGRDPADYIMRKAIGMAPFHLNQVSMYKAEVYIKGGGKIEKLPALIKRRMAVEANEVQIKEGEYYMAESVSIITFNAPDKYLNHVVSSRSNMPATDGQVSPMSYIEASFYQPMVADMAVSPLSPDAFSHYRFRFMGSTSQGDYTVDKIEVRPKRKSQQLFEGVIYIVEDLWAIHSLDLANENMAGRVKVRQLYTPVEKDVWLPVSHEFSMELSLIGIRASGSYTCAVKYLEVKTESAPAMAKETAPVRVNETLPAEKSKTDKEIEKILSKDEISPAEMSRLARLNEKKAKESRGEEPLEIKDRTTFEVEDDAYLRDSAYWEKVRPIPLTREETVSVAVMNTQQAKLAVRDTSSVTITAGKAGEKEEKSKAGAFASALFTGKNWQLSKTSYLRFEGLIDLQNFSFNTVDGFVAGTGLSFSTHVGDEGRFTVTPSARYAFSRERLMWDVSASLLHDPMTVSSFFLRAGIVSNEFSPSGVDPLVNTVSSLLFTANYMKLYKSSYLTVGHKGELANGLDLAVEAGYEHREPLENTTSFRFVHSSSEYTPNNISNPFAGEGVEGYEPMESFDHRNAFLSAELTWTPRMRYRITGGAKVNAGSDYPSFSILWRHGYNYNDTLSQQFDLLRASVSRNSDLGGYTELSWQVTGGGFINSHHVQLQDMYFFNTQKSPVLIDNYTDAFYLKDYYSMSSPGFFAGGHIRYLTPLFILKRLPGLSNTLMREKLSLSGLWTPFNGVYWEAGYGLSEIFFMAEAGVYTGFRGFSFEAVGLRLVLHFE